MCVSCTSQYHTLSHVNQQTRTATNKEVVSAVPSLEAQIKVSPVGATAAVGRVCATPNRPEGDDSPKHNHLVVQV